MRHSKFKNTGILFELLTRQVTADILAGRQESSAKDLLFKYFKENTELSKEWTLYSSLLTKKFKEETKAERFLSVIQEARKKLSNKKLNQEKYNNLLSKYNWAIIPTCKDEKRESSYHLYLLRIKGLSIEQRNAIIQKIFDKDVSVNVHYKPLPLLTAYKSRGYSLFDYPVSQSLWENEISLPIFYAMTDEMVLEVVNAVVNSYNEVLSITNS
jgi:hypothetical protein